MTQNKNYNALTIHRYYPNNTYKEILVCYKCANSDFILYGTKLYIYVYIVTIK